MERGETVCLGKWRVSSRPKIEFRQLNYFVAAAEHGSLRRAAAAICVQESTISRAIRAMEDKLGASLFHRHVGGVSLTFAGQRFLRRARIALQQIDDGIRDVAAIGRSSSGQIKIGILSSLASGFLAELLHAYGNNHAAVEIDLVDGARGEHVAAVRNLQLDVAFVTGQRSWIDCEVSTLWFEQLFIALPEGHVLAEKYTLDWSDLMQEHFIVREAATGPEIYDYLMQRLADLGHRPEFAPQRVGRDNLLSLVALGRGLTLTSKAATASTTPGIIYRPLADEMLPFSAVWSPRNDNPALRRLLSMARSMSNAAAS